MQHGVEDVPRSDQLAAVAAITIKLLSLQNPSPHQPVHLTYSYDQEYDSVAVPISLRFGPYSHSYLCKLIPFICNVYMDLYIFLGPYNFKGPVLWHSRTPLPQTQYNIYRAKRTQSAWQIHQ